MRFSGGKTLILPKVKHPTVLWEHNIASLHFKTSSSLSSNLIHFPTLSLSRKFTQANHSGRRPWPHWWPCHLQFALLVSSAILLLLLLSQHHSSLNIYSQNSHVVIIKSNVVVLTKKKKLHLLLVVWKVWIRIKACQCTSPSPTKF